MDSSRGEFCVAADDCIQHYFGRRVALLFAWLLSHAFSEYFSCRYLIQDSLGMPSFMCNGTILRL